MAIQKSTKYVKLSSLKALGYTVCVMCAIVYTDYIHDTYKQIPGTLKFIFIVVVKVSLSANQF